MAKSALLIKMIDLLKTRPGITVGELAAILGRSDRTVYRWLNEIAVDLQSPLYCHDGGYYFAGKPDLREVDLTPEELLALRLSLKSSLFGDGSPIKKYAESAWLKIRDAARFEELVEARSLASSRVVNINAPAGDVPTGLIETLEMAIDRRERLKVIYRSQKSGEVKDYTIDPYAMVFRRHSWYVLAFCYEQEKVIQMKLVRFRDAVKLGVRFDPPDDFSVDDYFDLSWEAWAGGEPTRVRVRFDQCVAPLIAEVKRHRTQVIHPSDDGGIIFEATVAGIEEIAIWIMGYGRHAEVLEPESLRRQIAGHVSGMAATYAPDVDKVVEAVEELDGLMA
ncbi:MAG: transcriptional regulator [Armatimonadetes bacterium]|nr:transcriptional regulator [Armatimonadota bacterium]